MPQNAQEVLQSTSESLFMSTLVRALGAVRVSGSSIALSTL